MKKLIAIFALLSIILSVTSCNKDDKVNPESDYLETLDKYDIFETKDVVLGNEVDSVEFTTKTGEKITFDNTAEFFEIFNKVGFEFEDGKKYSCNAETKLQDRSKSFINMNLYYFAGADLYEFRTKKEGDDNVALGEGYHYLKVKDLENNNFEEREFGIYTYKNEKALGGMERDENGRVSYVSDLYPMLPNSATELGEMFSRSNYLRSALSYADFFKYYEPYETNGVTIDFNEFVTREYKLYENYIVFKQTAPFLDVESGVGPGQDPDIIYAILNNSDCSITQEAYCNVKTGEIELIKVYGDTLWHTGEYLGYRLEIDMQMYIYDIDETKVKEKVDALINYIKSNVD